MAMLHAFRDDPSVGHAFIIDHALRDGSAKEAEQAAAIARSFGYIVKIDRWLHGGISTAIQSKARAYRYAALGQMCRAAGLSRLLTAHTEDDQAETLLMRLDRQTGWRGLAGMPEAAFGPLWPALAGLVLHRPWLNKSRGELRDYNQRYDLKFFDDPSNENTAFARIRARQAIAADVTLRADLLVQQKKIRLRLNQERQEHEAWFAAHASMSEHGFIETDAVPPTELLLHILNAVSGRGGPIEASKRARLCRDMESPDFKAATLGGAWVVRKTREKFEDGRHSFVFMRDRVAVSGRSGADPIQTVVLQRGVETLWDGRFFCCAKSNNLRIETGQGHLDKLRQLPDFKVLFDLPYEVRGSQPIFFLDDKVVGFGACDTEYISSTATSAPRLQALFGQAHLVSI